MNGFFDLGAFWNSLPEVYRANMRFTLGGATIEETRASACRFTLANVPSPKCPVLVVHGGRDRIFPPADARRIAGFVGGKGEMVEYPDGNHVCNNLAYRYRPLIADWLAEHLGGTTR
jgi:pimeloyl-ACP methyl ester carboxylesterase